MQVAMLPCPKPILVLTTRNGISRWTPPGGLPCEGGRQIRFNQISDEHNRGVRFGNGERETDSRASKMLLSIYIYIELAPHSAQSIHLPFPPNYFVAEAMLSLATYLAAVVIIG